MPNVLKALRAEIRQLSRSESKRVTQPLRDQLRRIRRSLTLIENRLQALKAGRSVAGSAAASRVEAGGGDGRRARFSPVLMKQHRAKVGLSRKAYATLLGVSSLTIYFWETGRTKPRRAAVLAWQSLRKRGVRALRAEVGASAAGVSAKRAAKRPTKGAAVTKRRSKKRAASRGQKPAAKKSGRPAKKRANLRLRRGRRGISAKAA